MIILSPPCSGPAAVGSGLNGASRPAYFSQDAFPTKSKLITPRVGWPRSRRSASNHRTNSATTLSAINLVHALTVVSHGYVASFSASFPKSPVRNHLSVPFLSSDEGRKAEVAPMTDRLRSSYERDWLPYTQQAARSAVLSAVGEALSCRYEIPQELPRENACALNATQRTA